MYEVLSKGMKYKGEKINLFYVSVAFSQYSEMYYNESSHYYIRFHLTAKIFLFILSEQEKAFIITPQTVDKPQLKCFI
jgi:hypothetical protein